MVSILICMPHLSFRFKFNEGITTGGTSYNVSDQSQVLNLSIFAHSLAKGLFSGEVRKVTDEDSAIRVSNELWIAKGVVEASLGTEESSVNGVVMREDVGAVNASCLNRMVCLCVEHRVYIPTHSLSLSLSLRINQNYKLFGSSAVFFLESPSQKTKQKKQHRRSRK